MYKVVLIVEEGTIVLTDVMSEASAIAWISRNKCHYGEEQQLALEYIGPYFGY